MWGLSLGTGFNVTGACQVPSWGVSLVEVVGRELLWTEGLWLLGPRGRASGAGPGQPLSVPSLEPPARMYKAICGCRLPFRGWEALGKGDALKAGWLVPGPGLLNQGRPAQRGQLLLVWGLWTCGPVDLWGPVAHGMEVHSVG